MVVSCSLHLCVCHICGSVFFLVPGVSVFFLAFCLYEVSVCCREVYSVVSVAVVIFSFFSIVTASAVLILSVDSRSINNRRI